MKFKIKVQRVVTDIQVVEVEATNLDHAKDKAVGIAFDEADWQTLGEQVTAEQEAA